MNSTGIPFPNIDPILFSIGPLAVHWYGVGYVVGILFAWWYAKRLLANARLWAPYKAPFTADVIEDLLTFAALGIILGGRLIYVLFYNFPKYAANPLEAVAIWDGGMSFHGGFIGCALAMVYVAWRHRVNVWSLFDVVAAGAPIGIGLVRIANFINQELWGNVTNAPWGVVFPNGGPLPRHPSQIYESLLEGFILFFVLAFLVLGLRKLRTPGFVAGFFVAWYGAARIFVEFFRVPDEQLGYLAGGWLTMGISLSAPMILVGLWMMATAKPLNTTESAAKPA